jgi:hypothetical protein
VLRCCNLALSTCRAAYMCAVGLLLGLVFALSTCRLADSCAVNALRACNFGAVDVVRT